MTTKSECQETNTAEQKYANTISGPSDKQKNTEKNAGKRREDRHGLV